MIRNQADWVPEPNDRCLQCDFAVFSDFVHSSRGLGISESGILFFSDLKIVFLIKVDI